MFIKYFLSRKKYEINLKYKVQKSPFLKNNNLVNRFVVFNFLKHCLICLLGLSTYKHLRLTSSVQITYFSYYRKKCNLKIILFETGTNFYEKWKMKKWKFMNSLY